MQPEIRTTPIHVSLVGAAKQHDPAKHYGEEIIALLDRVWPPLKNAKIPTKGINWVVYDADDMLFAGVELADPSLSAAQQHALTALQQRTISPGRHAYWKHVGPYHLLGKVCADLNAAVKAMGLQPGWPLIEVYGHWNNDESKLETEILLPVSE